MLQSNFDAYNMQLLDAGVTPCQTGSELGMLGLCCWRECGQCTFHPGPGQLRQHREEEKLCCVGRLGVTFSISALCLVLAGNCLYLPMTSSRPALLRPACNTTGNFFLVDHSCSEQKGKNLISCAGSCHQRDSPYSNFVNMMTNNFLRKKTCYMTIIP